MRPIPHLLVPLVAAAAASAETLRFDFGAASARPGWTPVTETTLYAAGTGHGLVRTGPVRASAGAEAAGPSGDALVSTEPFTFAIRLPEGNYDVVLQLGDPAGSGNTWVKAESRRLMLEGVSTASGTTTERRFTVNVRTADLRDGRKVGLKPRERDVFHWDDTLMLEFCGPRPAVASLEITPNAGATTVFLAGDSTVTDQPGEPWAAWGQMLPRFLPAGVAVSNHAESGLSLATFRASRRLDKILEMLRPGDWVLIQFGHNDQKENGEGVGAHTTYARSLRDYVAAIRAGGGNPVLITPMYRRRFNEKGLFDTLGDFPDAVRDVAAETGTPLVDLHALSARMLRALGPERSKRAFVHYKAGAFPDAKEDVRDDTHFSPYGAYELARCVAGALRTAAPALGARLRADFDAIDPDAPMDPDAFGWPPSPPRGELRIPDGDGR